MPDRFFARGRRSIVELKGYDEAGCRNLWAAVLRRAISDMAYADSKSSKGALTGSERDKLQRIHAADSPESFFRSEWFEEICRYLELSAGRVRDVVLDPRRRDSAASERR